MSLQVGLFNNGGPFLPEGVDVSIVEVGLERCRFRVESIIHHLKGGLDGGVVGGVVLTLRRGVQLRKRLSQWAILECISRVVADMKGA